MTSYISSHTLNDPNLNYSSAFPPLQAFPWSFQNKKMNHHGNHPNKHIHFHTSIAPPKYPSYLKHTLYSSLLLDQYHHHLHNRSKISVSDNNNAELDEIDLRLPQHWQKNDRRKYIEIGINGYDLIYTDVGQNHTAIVHSNFPVRPQCGVYYYEVSIISKGRDGLISVGVCTSSKASDHKTWAYHADDGNLYEQCSTMNGQKYGPSLTSGDVIGCGINFSQSSIFYTKNGVYLGTAFHSINTLDTLYPFVGLSTLGESISANFGQSAFLFDIVEYIKIQQEEVIKPIKENRVTSDVNSLILSYLIHHGYTGTALALNENIKTVNKVDYLHQSPQMNNIRMKHQLRQAMISGHIKLAMQMTEEYYPGLLATHESIRFQMKCRDYIESVLTVFMNNEEGSDSDLDDVRSCSTGRSRTHSMDSIREVSYEDEIIHIEPKPCPLGHYVPPITGPVPVIASGRRLSWAAIAASPANNRFSPSSTHSVSSCPSLDYFDEGKRRNNRRHSDDSIHYEEEEDDKYALLRETMHAIKNEFDHNVKYRTQITEHFSLLSYSNPHMSPMASLLDQSHRYSLVNELNIAIQIYHQQPIESPLESIYKQAIHVNKQLAILGHGESSLIQLEKHLIH